MTNEIRARRNEGKRLKTLRMNTSKFIVRSADSSIMTAVGEPDIFVALVDSGHTYEIYVKYTNSMTWEIYERSCEFVTGLIPGSNLCYEVYVTDTGVKINTEDIPGGTKDMLRIHACGELPEMYTTIEFIDVTNICNDLESKNGTKTETDKYAYAKSDDIKIPSSCRFVCPSNNAPDEQVGLFITFLKDRRRDQIFSKMNEGIAKADDEDDVREDIEAMQTETSVLLANVECIINRNNRLQRDLRDLLQYPEYKDLVDTGSLVTDYVTRIVNTSKYLNVILSLLYNKLEK